VKLAAVLLLRGERLLSGSMLELKLSELIGDMVAVFEDIVGILGAIIAGKNLCDEGMAAGVSSIVVRRVVIDVGFRE